MKSYIALLALIASSCANYTISPAVVINNIPEESALTFESEKASHLLKTLRKHDYVRWENEIRKIRNAYTTIIKILDEKETVQFTVAFFRVLSLSEDLDRQVFTFYEWRDDLPNIDVLKFLYRAEKELDKMVALLSPFTKSSNHEIKHCAAEAERYFQYQRDLFITVRDVDYRNLKACEVPSEIPPEVLRANAKLLEQRDQMSACLISFYENFAEKRN